MDFRRQDESGLRNQCQSELTSFAIKAYATEEEGDEEALQRDQEDQGEALLPFLFSSWFSVAVVGSKENKECSALRDHGRRRDYKKGDNFLI